MQLSIFNSLLPQVFTSQLNVLYIQAQPQVTVHNFLRPLPFWWAQMDSNHRRFGLRDFSNLKTVRKVIHSSRATGSCWWAQMDSNHRPHAYQACALTNWAMSPCLVEINGFEPLTPCLQGRCSSQLSYTPASSNHKVFVLPSSRGTLYITNAPPFTPEHSLQLKIW